MAKHSVQVNEGGLVGEDRQYIATQLSEWRARVIRAERLAAEHPDQERLRKALSERGEHEDPEAFTVVIMETLYGPPEKN